MTTERRGPRPAEARLRRLLVMLPWLMERAEVPVVEVANRFALTEAEVVKDLELASMCGLPPFVDELIDVYIDEGVIYVGVPRLFVRPLRLNSVEAFELLAAGRAAMQLPGADAQGPLGRGLLKLARALGEDDTGVLRVDLARPGFTDDVAAALEAGAEVSIDYWSASRDESTTRVIVPRQLFSDRGEWYVRADDDRSGEVRTFRVDRIESMSPTGRIVTPSDEPLPPPGEWFADGSIRRVTLRLAPAARWVSERYPMDDVSEPDAKGYVTVRLAVASERWLERTLLRLGPDAEVLDFPELATAVRASAERVLARYR
ncbi:MAG TPA: WYL domain-containing protein [Ilumatobacter sp.]|nr:WYL domain-containing protein [Ilumatobacter sp.]